MAPAKPSHSWRDLMQLWGMVRDPADPTTPTTQPTPEMGDPTTPAHPDQSAPSSAMPTDLTSLISLSDSDTGPANGTGGTGPSETDDLFASSTGNGGSTIWSPPPTSHHTVTGSLDPHPGQTQSPAGSQHGTTADGGTITPTTLASFSTDSSSLSDPTLAAPQMMAALATTTTTTTTTTTISPPLSPLVVQMIDTTHWPNPSPDPAGIAWIPGSTPGTGKLLVSDSEIDETPFFRPDNLFVLSETGAFDHSTSLESFTKEPTGLAYDPLNHHLFISDDVAHKVFEVDPNNPGTLISSFSTLNFGANDTEDIGFDPVTGHLLVVEGEQGTMHPRTIFETTTNGTVVSTVQLPSTLGDPEAIAYDPTRNVYYMGGETSADIFVVSRDGQLLDTINLLEGYGRPDARRVLVKALTLAPSSDPNDDPNTMSLWVADYGSDQFMDGRLFELQLSPTSTLPPLFTANNDVVDFGTVFAGSYLYGSEYNALGGNDTVSLPVDAAAATASGYDTTQPFHGWDGNDAITGGNLAETIYGDAGDDKLIGRGGDDTLYGGAGKDTLSGGLGNDLLNGGSGTDTADYSASSTGVVVDLSLGTATGEGNDKLVSVENVIGSAFADHLTGDGLANSLTGGGGSDILHGNGGNDTLTGGSGIDQLFGDAGNDTLKWDSADKLDGGAGFDTVNANLSSADTIDLRGPNIATVERIQTGGGNDTVTLSLSDVLSDTADHQFVADLGSGTDTLNIDTSGGWTATTANTTLGPTGTAAGISIAGMTAHSFTNGSDTVTVFSNAEVTHAQIIA